MSTAVLSCRNLDAGYRDLRVVRALNLSVHQSEIVLLLGPNGAGKTTTLLTIAGLLPSLSGNVEVCGQSVTPDRPHLLARRGLAFVPDTRQLVSGLSVRDNIRVATRSRRQQIDEILDLFPALRQRLKIQASQLSGGEQQMLAIGRALINKPKALVIDEMSMGLAPIIVEELLETLIQAVRDTNTAVLLVEQHVALGIHAADRVYVMVHGEVTLESSCEDLRGYPERLTEAYLGADTKRPY